MIIFWLFNWDETDGYDEAIVFEDKNILDDVLVE
jgi:hypothetical protein